MTFVDKYYSKESADKESSVSNVSYLYLTFSTLILFTIIFIILLLPAVHAQNVTINRYQNLSNNSGNSIHPQIAVLGNNVYVVWSDTSSGNGDIYFRRSTDNGTSFGSTENLSNNSGNSIHPQIAVLGNNVYVVWSDTSSGNGDIYFRRSDNSGTIFRSTENLSNNSGNSIHPQIAVLGNNVYVVWSDTSSGNGDIYFRRSTDNGTLFKPTINNISKNSSGLSSVPQVSSAGNNVYVIWQDKVSGNNEIFLRVSKDTGGTFSGIKNLSRNNTGDSISPQISVDGNNVYVAWSDSTPGKSEIFLRVSNDMGDKFRGNKNVSFSNGSSYDPQIDLSGNKLYVLWEDNSIRGLYFDLLFRASLDQGRNFTEKEDVGKYISQLSDYGQIAALKNSVYIVWSGSGSLEYNYPNMFEIFFRGSRDNGTNFSDAINLSNNAGNSIFPQIALSQNNTVYVVWSDTTSGNGDIYFVKLQNII